MRDIMSAKRGQVTICVWKFSHNIFLVSHQEVLFGAQACEEIFSEGKNTFEKNKHGLMGSVWQEHWERILLFYYENKCKTQNPPQHIVALITGHLALWCFTDTVFFTNGRLWQPCIKKVYRHHFPNIICLIYHILLIAVFQTCSLLCLLQWSMISDLWCYY